MIMKTFKQLYESTIYSLDELNFTLFCNERNRSWDKFCKQCSIVNYALITPYNPQSKKIEDWENRQRLIEFTLMIEEHGYAYFKYRSIDPRGEWEDELGLVLINRPLEESVEFAERYNQVAIVEALVGNPLKLLWLI